MGGDGTLSEAVSGYMAREPSAATCTLGFVPAGTGNTYLREVLGLKAKSGLDACVRAAVAAILGGRVRAVDAAKLELTGLGENAERRISRYAINTVMAGFGPDANAAAERRRFLGPLRYNLSIYTELLKIPCRKPMPCTLTLDGKANALDDLFLLAIQNNKFTGIEHRLCPRAQLDDGLLDAVYTNRPIKGICKAIALDSSVKGGGKHVLDPIVSYSRVTTARFEAGTPTRVMVDGDIVGLTPLDVTAIKGAFPLFTPEDPAPM